MILSQTTSCASKFGEEKAIEIIANAGFDAIDYNMESLKDDKGILFSDNYKDYVLNLLEVAKKNNVYFNQGHAVGYIPHENHDMVLKMLVEKNSRAIEISGIMGIKTLIIHPVAFEKYIGNEEYVFEKNMKYFNALLPYAEEYGVKLACENMWCNDKRKKVSIGGVCGNPFEHAKYIDEINNPLFVACIDVGHCSLSGREPQDCIRVLGNRLGALHIHDNDYLDDMHTLPGLSEINFDEVMKALKDIDYKGDFTFETDHFFDSLNTIEETETGMKLAALIGRKLIAQIEN